MGLRPLSVQTGESLDRMLAEALGIYSEGIAPDHLAVAREFAFSSDSLIEFAEWYLRAECFSKYSVSGDDLSRAEAALDKFKEAEAQCHRLNERLVDPWSRVSLNQDVWKRARALIGSVLGPFPWEELPTCVGFGPGASTEMRASHAFLQNKWALSTHIDRKSVV